MKADHITPQSWVGDVNLCNVSVITSWNQGHQMVESKFSSAGIEEALVQLEKKGYDFTFPFGQRTDSEDDLHDPEDREEQEELTVMPEPLNAQTAAEMVSANSIR